MPLSRREIPILVLHTTLISGLGEGVKYPAYSPCDTTFGGTFLHQPHTNRCNPFLGLRHELLMLRPNCPSVPTFLRINLQGRPQIYNSNLKSSRAIPNLQGQFQICMDNSNLQRRSQIYKDNLKSSMTIPNLQE